MHINPVAYSFLFFVFALTYSETKICAEEIYIDKTPETTSVLIKRKSILIIKQRAERPKTTGVRVGNYTLTSAISLTEYYDDNVYATETAAQDDMVSLITPTFNLKSNWKQHAAEFDAGLEVARYADLTTENTTNAWASIKGNYDINAGHHISADISYLRDHEDRASPDAQVGSTPTKFDDTTGRIGYTGIVGNNYFTLIYNNKQLDFHDVDSTSGTIDNDDRDRSESGVGIKYLYKYSSTVAYFLKAAADSRRYARTPDNEGNLRNSDGFQYSLGFEYVSTNAVSSMYAGSLMRDYQSALFKDPEVFNFGLRYIWKFTPQSSFSIHLRRSIEETTINLSPGYLMTEASSQVIIGLNTRTDLFINATATRAEYYAISREDDYMDYSAGYNQKILDNLRLSIELHHSERDSNIAGDDYNINQVFLRINAAI